MSLNSSMHQALGYQSPRHRKARFVSLDSNLECDLRALLQMRHHLNLYIICFISQLVCLHPSIFKFWMDELVSINRANIRLSIQPLPHSTLQASDLVYLCILLLHQNQTYPKSECATLHLNSCSTTYAESLQKQINLLSCHLHLIHARRQSCDLSCTQAGCKWLAIYPAQAAQLSFRCTWHVSIGGRAAIIPDGKSAVFLLFHAANTLCAHLGMSLPE